MRKVINIISNVIFKIFFVLICAGLISWFCFGIHWYVVPTGSMEPNIHVGSLAFVNTKAEYEEIEKGDIIVYNNGVRLIIHRAVDIDEEGITTQGDSNERPDMVKTTKDNFVGKEICVIPKVGIYLEKLNDVKNKIIYAIAVIALFIINMVTDEDFQKNRKNKDKDKNEIEAGAEPKTSVESEAPLKSEDSVQTEELQTSAESETTTETKIEKESEEYQSEE